MIPFLSLKNLTQKIPLQLGRGLCISGAMLCSYTAYRHLPSHTAGILGTSGPLFALFLSVLFLKERLSLQKWVLIFLGYTGVLIIIGPFNLSATSYEGVSLLGNLLGSVAILIARSLAQNPSLTSASLFYGAFIPLLIFSVGLPNFWTPLQGSQWLVLAGIGGIGALSQLFMFSALRNAAPSFTAPFEYLRLCVFSLMSWFIFHELPSPSFYLGSLILLGSLAGLMVIKR
jgi:drug/metabolite transporter (DMT)-like permease